MKMDMATITEGNIEHTKQMCGAIDQRNELIVGCVTWGIIYEGGQRGQMTRWPNGRGAVAYGGDSQWGDWESHNGHNYLHLDDDGYVNEAGNYHNSI